jgi:hypothetical protein
VSRGIIGLSFVSGGGFVPVRIEVHKGTQAARLNFCDPCPAAARAVAVSGAEFLHKPMKFTRLTEVA